MAELNSIATSVGACFSKVAKRFGYHNFLCFSRREMFLGVDFPNPFAFNYLENILRRSALKKVDRRFTNDFSDRKVIGTLEKQGALFLKLHCHLSSNIFTPQYTKMQFR